MLTSIRDYATGIALTLIGMVVAGFVGANVRAWAHEKGYDTWLLQMSSKLPAGFARMKIGWPALRQRWWLWLAMGLSGGLAGSLWAVTSFSEMPTGSMPGSQSAAAPVVLRSQLEMNLRAEAKKAQTELENVRRIAERPRMGVHSAFSAIDRIIQVNPGLHFANVPPAPSQLRWAILISSPDENAAIKGIIMKILQHALLGNYIQLSIPDTRDRDAPKISDQEDTEIILHGDNVLTERLLVALDCFIIYKTKTIPADIEGYYKKSMPSDSTLVWIQIGKGPPWRNPGGCPD